MTDQMDYRILLVEGRHDDGEAIRALLQVKQGFDVVHVGRLSPALHELRVSQFDAVLLDLTLPDSTGLDTLSVILSVAPGLPVVVLTSQADADTAMRALQHGAQDFLTKGEVDENLLWRSIQYAIERSRLEKERNELGRQLLDAVSAEQLRIGRELHDGIGQGLGGLSMMSRALARKLAARGLAEAASAEAIAKGIHGVLVELRQVLRGLNPVDLEQTPLPVALEHLCETVTDLHGVDCIFQGHDSAEVGDHSTAVHLYRITQEALHNALRHGAASKLVVRLRQEDSEVILEVEDDGCGFDVNQPVVDGLGLRFMQHRSRLIAGRLEIESIAGHGTLVRCNCRCGTTRV